MSWQKELESADAKSIQQIKFVGQLKKLENRNADAESILIVTILEKIKEAKLKFSQGSVAVL